MAKNGRPITRKISDLSQEEQEELLGRKSKIDSTNRKLQGAEGLRQEMQNSFTLGSVKEATASKSALTEKAKKMREGLKPKTGEENETSEEATFQYPHMDSPFNSGGNVILTRGRDVNFDELMKAQELINDLMKEPQDDRGI